MEATKGYFSLIQFCPNMSRLESVNVGVLLSCPERAFVRVRMSGSNERASKLLGRKNLDIFSLKQAKLAMERRITLHPEFFLTREEIEQFAATRANSLYLTKPRSISVLDPERELENLFNELVGGPPPRKQKQPVIPQLDKLFDELAKQGRAERGVTVTLPFSHRRFTADYAYQNGCWNFVKPMRFASIPARAMASAEHLALSGQLLRRHPVEEFGSPKLFVVASFSKSPDSRPLFDDISQLLGDFGVQAIPEERVEVLIRDIEVHALPHGH